MNDDLKNAMAARARAGFTLLEILVVVLIISILATIVGINVIPQLGKGKTAVATAQISTFRTALNLYRMQHGQYPTQAQGLEALIARPVVAPVPTDYPDEGYLEALEVPLDPWGHDYVYLVPGTGRQPYEIVCYGADGEPGGDGENADITSADPQRRGVGE